MGYGRLVRVLKGMVKCMDFVLRNEKLVLIGEGYVFVV